MDLQDPDSKMATTGGTEQGTVYVLDEPDDGAQEGPQRRHRLRAPRSAAGPDKAGDREPDRDPRRSSAASTPEEVEREFDGSGYGDFKAAVAEAVVDYLAPVRERYAELRPDEAALEATLAGGRREGARDRLRDARRRPRARWASDRRTSLSRDRASAYPFARCAPPSSSSTSTSSRARSTC